MFKIKYSNPPEKEGNKHGKRNRRRLGALHNVMRVEGVEPKSQADMTGHAVNRTTAGETTGSRTTAWCGWRESNPRLNLGKVT
jgi:hypothetical protein